MIELSSDIHTHRHIQKTNMQMPPPPPSPSSADGDYLGINAMSARLKALEEKILRQIGPVDATAAATAAATTPNRNTARHPTTLIRQTPGKIDSTRFVQRCSFAFQRVSTAHRSLGRVQHLQRAKASSIFLSLLFN